MYRTAVLIGQKEPKDSTCGIILVVPIVLPLFLEGNNAARGTSGSFVVGMLVLDVISTSP